ncbi:hypothetical protein D3C85_1333600 [compost metagenome]
MTDKIPALADGEATPFEDALHLAILQYFHLDGATGAIKQTIDGDMGGIHLTLDASSLHDAQYTVDQLDGTDQLAAHLQIALNLQITSEAGPRSNHGYFARRCGHTVTLSSKHPDSLHQPEK